MLGILVLVVVVACCAAVAVWLVLDPTEPFNREQWQADPDGRLPMARDICENGLLDASTRAQVVQLLGPPADTDAAPDSAEVLWYAGLDTMDENSIHVRFGPDGRVAEYDLQQH